MSISGRRDFPSTRAPHSQTSKWLKLVSIHQLCQKAAVFHHCNFSNASFKLVIRITYICALEAPHIGSWLFYVFIVVKLFTIVLVNHNGEIIAVKVVEDVYCPIILSIQKCLLVHAFWKKTSEDKIVGIVRF